MKRFQDFLLRRWRAVLVVGIAFDTIICAAIGYSVFNFDLEWNICGAIPKGVWGFFGNDTWTYLRAGCNIKFLRPFYLAGKWAIAQPDNPNINPRFFPLWYWPLSFVDPASWPLVKMFFTFLIMG